MGRGRAQILALALTLSPAVPVLAAEPATVVLIDARSPSQTPGPSSYRGGTLTSSTGHTLGMNSMYLTLDGKPWLPVMGEFHFSRVPEAEWESEILKMKAAGVQIVATYVIWIHHEEVEGQFDWSGQRDLHRFVELCGRHGMYVMARVGPWAHGEARNGGLPDWLLKKGPTRRNSPAYMGYVAKFYAQIAQQIAGMLWKDGGPVIGVQLENEYAGRGPEQGDEYILALKKLAVQDGLDVPLYTVTGWDNAVVPKGQVIPVFGGYPDAPWDAARTELPPSEVYMYRLHSRVAGNMDMMGGKQSSQPSEADNSDTPFITAEMGGGIEDTYHRRPVVQPDDIAAMMPVMLGSGVNLYGTYMFQGGENPNGRLTTLQESQSTGYPTDVPVKSYDFQAPLGEFGHERESFRKLKVFDYFLNDFGSELAPMSVHAPTKTPAGPADFSVVRASVRSSGQAGFLFVNNFVRGDSMPERKAVQFEIRLPHSTLHIPESPIDIPGSAYFIWPFNRKIGAETLRYSTAQLFMHLAGAAADIYIFEQIPGIEAEFVLEDSPDLNVRAGSATVRRQEGVIRLSRIPTGFSNPMSLRRGSGPAVKLIVLTQTEAENTWKTSVRGEKHVVETAHDFFSDNDSFVLQSEGDPHFTFALYPRVQGELRAPGADLKERQDGDLTLYTGEVAAENVAVHVEKVQDAGQAPGVKVGPAPSWRPQGVAMAPGEDAFEQAARWRITFSGDVDHGALINQFLTIRYTGDVARLLADGKLLEDNFYNGLPWSVGLRRFGGQIGQSYLELSILPLREGAPIFLEKRFRPGFGGKNQAVQLVSVEVNPQYQVRVE